METALQARQTLAEQLARARQELDILYHEFSNIIGDRSDPFHYQNLNARSLEIAAKTAEVCALEQKIIKLARSAISS